MLIKKIWEKGKRINFKTIYFNFHYFPLKTALRFPVFISRGVLLRKANGHVHISGPVKTGMIEIGHGDVTIFDKARSRTIWDVSGKVIFKGTAYLGHGSRISVNQHAVLQLGDNFEISAESAIIVYNEVSFGKDCLLSWDILIMDSDGHTIRDKNGNSINEPKPVRVGDRVWIGARSTLLKGAEIPSGSVIALGSIVSKKLEGENKVFGGSPARELKADISWER